MIGRLLDGRYQVRSRIARGGMATVYLATDLRLERRVAIKVMHHHLADDTQYKLRFIQEARSAARLAHPNVVNVYDQGQDDETAYLVMEYLPGITLRDLLNEHKMLTTEQAMDIMEAVLSGLAAAHRSGIVHRDLKPENVLLADDGRIKISDFGLARAASANTATGNALLGTIAYLSPELVTRGVADTRSDIYAVGIMLYEMLAGEQPYKGEQPFQIAQQHANDTVPTPSTKNPRVPPELDELVLWSTARDPEQRPRDAGAMLEQLFETQRLLTASDGSGAAAQHTMVMPMAISNAATGATQVLAPLRVPRPASDLGANADALAKKSQKRRARGGWLFGLVLLLTAVAVGTGWYFGAGPGSLVTIADVAGLDQAAATDVLVAQDLEVSGDLKSAFDPTIPEGLVSGTDPAAGIAVAHGGLVHLILSRGPEPLPVPELVGQPEEEAMNRVEEARFALEPTQYRFNDAAKGLVILALGTDGVDLTTLETYGDQQPVTLIVSLGPLPDVAGRSVDDARNMLSDAGLTGEPTIEEYSDTIEAGNAIRVQLQAGQEWVGEGGTVDIVVSKGVEQVAVPETAGKTWRAARQELEAAGFAISFANPLSQFLSAIPDNAVVKSTSPGGGTAADKGSTITVDLKAG